MRRSSRCATGLIIEGAAPASRTLHLAVLACFEESKCKFRAVANGNVCLMIILFMSGAKQVEPLVYVALAHVFSRS